MQMIKNANYWLDQLPPNISFKAELNIYFYQDDNNISYDYLQHLNTMNFLTLKIFLLSAFVWSETNEGEDFWNLVASGTSQFKTELFCQKFSDN